MLKNKLKFKSEKRFCCSSREKFVKRRLTGENLQILNRKKYLGLTFDNNLMDAWHNELEQNKVV